jgi:hypothetical protein
MHSQNSEQNRANMIDSSITEFVICLIGSLAVTVQHGLNPEINLPALPACIIILAYQRKNLLMHVPNVPLIVYCRLQIIETVLTNIVQKIS